MIELVVLSFLVAAVPLLVVLAAWWVSTLPSLPLSFAPDRRWEGPALQRVGLSLTGESGARGVAHGFVVEVGWRFSKVTVSLKGPAAPDPTQVVQARKTVEALFHGRGWDADPHERSRWVGNWR